MAGAAPSQGQVQISRQAQHFVPTGIRIETGAALWECELRSLQIAPRELSVDAQISWQARRFCKVKCRFRGALAMSSADFMAGATPSPGQVLPQGQAQIDR